MHETKEKWTRTSGVKSVHQNTLLDFPKQLLTGKNKISAAKEMKRNQETEGGWNEGGLFQKPKI